MILTIAPIGMPLEIKSIKGKDAQQKLLSNMGFVVGGNISIVNENRGNLIVKVKESRVAIGKDLSNRIQVEIIKEME